MRILGGPIGCVLALGLALAGCGRSAPAASPADTLVEKAVAALDQQGTFRFEAEMAGVVPGQGPTSWRESGVVDLRANAADLRFPQSRTLIVGGREYVSPPPFPAPGKSWLMLPDSASRGALSLFPDPLGWGKTLRRIAGAKVVGTQPVRGVQTTHITARVRIPTTAGSALPAEVAVDLWVDQQDRIRELHLAGHGTKNLSVDVTYWFSDFGIAVHLAVPSAAQVATVPSAPPGGTAFLTPAPGG